MDNQNLTTVSPDTDDRFRYGDLFPLISGVIAWTLIITLFIAIRHVCAACVKKTLKCSNRCSLCMSETRPFSYCWTYTEPVEERSRNNSLTSDTTPYNRSESYIRFMADPPDYFQAVNMPKPEHHEMEEVDIPRFSFNNEAFDESVVSDGEGNNNNNTDNVSMTDTIYTVYTETELPTYDDAIASYEIINESRFLNVPVHNVHSGSVRSLTEYQNQAETNLTEHNTAETESEINVSNNSDHESNEVATEESAVIDISSSRNVDINSDNESNEAATGESAVIDISSSRNEDIESSSRSIDIGICRVDVEVSTTRSNITPVETNIENEC